MGSDLSRYDFRDVYFPVESEETASRRYGSGRRQTHTHEFTASTELALRNDLRHNHRFAGVTGEAIPVGDTHIHKIKVNTTFVLGHFHEVIVKTGPARTVNHCGRPDLHIHFVEGETTVNGAVPHDHDVRFVVLAAPNPPDC
jgi:hypothetical protein